MAISTLALIVSLADAQRSPRTGSKATNLSKLIAARFAVPRGFVISADAYRSHLWASGARDLASCTADAETRVNLREAILSAPIPDDVWQGIADAYKHLSYQSGLADPRVAVRSSAVEEGCMETGFAGAYESFLNVSGLDALHTAVLRVWASLWNGKAAAYRTKHGVNAEPAMAVIVQEMVEAKWFGTALTADPVTGNPHNVLIFCSSAGDEGRKAAAAMDLPHYRVDLRDFSWVERGDQLDRRPDPAVVSLVAEKAVLIEDAVGPAVDVEWAHDGERLWFLQARPIADLPSYFPMSQEGFDEAVRWKRLSDGPACHFSRSLPGKAANSFPSLRDVAERRLISGHVYSREIEVGEDKRQSRTIAKDVAAGPRLLAQWQRETGPSLRSRASAVVCADLTGADHPCLLGYLSEASEVSRAASDWLDTARYASTLFPELLRRLLEPKSEDASLYVRLLGGLPDPTIMRDARLQELGERFHTAEGAGKSEDRAWWLGYKKDADDFAREYGYSFRCAGELADIASWEGWLEDTDAVFRIISVLAERDDRPTLITLHNASERNAEEAAGDAALLFKGGDRAAFANALESARGWLAAANDVEQVYALASVALRLGLVEIGRRLRECRMVSEIGDVFNLTLDELLALPAEPTDSDRAATSAAIARRRHDLWLERRLVAPDELPLGDDELASRLPSTEGALVGRPASPGAATGRVRVVRTLTEAGELENGEVLIVESPSLAWTPLLAVAGALVSERDFDTPAHAALVREYGIPAVVGCVGILSAVKNGDRITVDGSGVVDLPGRRTP